MSPEAKEKILSAVELALGFPRRDEEILKGRSTGEVRWVHPWAPWDSVEKELSALSARFHRVEDRGQLWDLLGSIVEEHGVRNALMWDHPLLEKLKVAQFLDEKGVRRVDTSDPERFRMEAAKADVGITAAEALIEESGAIVVRAAREMPRAASLLPPIHVAIISSAQRISTIWDIVPLWRSWLEKEGRLPSAVHFITGPSRTADIELTLVLGAHGPKVLHVVALPEELFSQRE